MISALRSFVSEEPAGDVAFVEIPAGSLSLEAAKCLEGITEIQAVDDDVLLLLSGRRWDKESKTGLTAQSLLDQLVALPEEWQGRSIEATHGAVSRDDVTMRLDYPIHWTGSAPSLKLFILVKETTEPRRQRRWWQFWKRL